MKIINLLWAKWAFNSWFTLLNIKSDMILNRLQSLNFFHFMSSSKCIVSLQVLEQRKSKRVKYENVRYKDYFVTSSMAKNADDTKSTDDCYPTADVRLITFVYDFNFFCLNPNTKNQLKFFLCVGEVEVMNY